LIERSGQLRQHAGQLAFPGGKPEASDRDLLDTALREAWEEVGLPHAAVSVLGRLSPVPTPTGYMIVPYVGRVLGDWQPQRASGQTPRARQTEKLLPQPQLPVVLGFPNLKPAPCKPST
jgi:8-oxo-dGTP pyrophosphatase MutT (NUDIX family)